MEFWGDFRIVAVFVVCQPHCLVPFEWLVNTFRLRIIEPETDCKRFRQIIENKLKWLSCVDSRGRGIA